jgi:plasmid replication initiation protein
LETVRIEWYRFAIVKASNEQIPLFDIEKSRVTQANSLARAVQQMDILEKRLLAIGISRLRWEQADFTTIEMPMSELKDVLGRKNKNIYKMVQNAARGLLKRTVYIEDEDGGWTEFQWVSEAKYIPAKKRPDKTSVIRLRLHDNLKPYLLQLKDNYNSMPISEIIYMSSFSSLRLFEILFHDSFRGKKAVLSYELDDLKKRLGIAEGSYESFKDFRYILEKAQEDVEKHTSLCFAFKGIKQGLFIKQVQFAVRPNPKYKAPPAPSEKSLPGDKDLDADEEALVAALLKAGYRQDARKLIQEFGYERVYGNFQLARKSIMEGQAGGNPIKNPGGFIYDMIKKDIATTPGKEKRHVDVDDLARQLADTFHQERNTHLQTLWEALNPEEQAEIHETMREKLTFHSKQLLEEANWEGLIYESSRNPFVIEKCKDRLPEHLRNVTTYMLDRELFVEHPEKLRTAIAAKAQELVA